MNKNILSIALIILWLLFVIKNSNNKEGFINDCPDILIEKDGVLSLFNSKLAEIPGVNPIKFNGLEDYVEYLDWQRSQKINCPVLYLQHSYDAQGNAEYKQRPSPTELQGGLPPVLQGGLPPVLLEQSFSNESKLLDSNRNDPPYNKNSYPGFDPENQYIGLDTPLDKMYHQNFDGISPNPMDSNWAGQEFTQGLIDKNYYINNNIFKNKS
tara:strand:+ start:195 stop:827 length:633 start_codon:yes stop_codon:yes gene_type:complete